LSSIASNLFAQHNSGKSDSLVTFFYADARNTLFWFPSDENLLSAINNWISGNGEKRVNRWLDALESADSLGIVVNKEEISRIRAVLSSKTMMNDRTKAKTDSLITDLVLHFIKDLQQGTCRFDYDNVSINRDSMYISQLLKPRFPVAVSKFISSLDCKDHDYTVYKRFLRDSIPAPNSFKRKAVVLAMNYRRFFSVNYQSEFIIVNIPQAQAWYYRNGVLAITMRAVVGKKTKQTPTIASYISSITTFPNWDVPHQIAVDEILPKVQKDENYLEQNNFEVVDAKGNEVDDSALNWADFTKNNFPYYFRQFSGSENALGVVKFDLQDPFSIFLHGTSNQSAFSRDYRFLSHGCIRLEKPFDLADSLLRGKIDIKELKTGKTDKGPNAIMLQRKIPAFIIYMPVEIDGERVTFLKDVYGLIE
jgi:murein L,D-transpeptidase YcbB/YkuD